MHALTPPFVAFVALLVKATGTAEVKANPIPSSEITSLHNELRSCWERRRSSLLGIAFLVASGALLFLVLQCFKALQSDKNASSSGVNRRRLAEGGVTSCNVRGGKQGLDICFVYAYTTPAKPP